MENKGLLKIGKRPGIGRCAGILDCKKQIIAENEGLQDRPAAAGRGGYARRQAQKPAFPGRLTTNGAAAPCLRRRLLRFPQNAREAVALRPTRKNPRR
jgi:hypothetical protein